ncbi:MAG: cysteine desulfurase [Acholeplasmatales bacterium]|jgi:cysteine desulfurase/selenocysteine lyase|nr:cysteine desulfurase [Acholeplasmatales bacterium]
MLDVAKIRKQFPIYKKNSSLVYLDSAASSLVPRSVIKSEIDYYSNNGTNVHRGVYKLSYQATLDYDNSRNIIASFINASDNEIIFTKGTTDSLNMICDMLSSVLHLGDIVLTTELEHHSSLLPWRNKEKEKGITVKYIPLSSNKITIENFVASISSDVKVLAITHVSNTLGYLTPIKEIIKIAHKHNIIVVLDCAQSILHEKIDVKKLDVDFLAFSGHKIFGPSGIGVLFGKEQYLNSLLPRDYGGEMVDTVTKNDVTYKESPFREEAGTPNIAGAIGLGYAIRFIKKIGVNNIKEHTLYLRNYTIAKLKEIKEVIIYNLEGETSLILFNIKNIHPHDVASDLDNDNICVRAGFHCAKLVGPLLDTISTLRVSFSVYNDINDCDLFIKSLQKTIKYWTEI